MANIKPLFNHPVAPETAVGGVDGCLDAGLPDLLRDVAVEIVDLGAAALHHILEHGEARLSDEYKRIAGFARDHVT